MKKGEKYKIHGYKHNGKLYKTWDEAILLDETDDYYVFGNKNTKVTKMFGKSWYTRETAILFYFKNTWYNVVAQLKKNGIYYYCNIASPVVIDNKTIKFIDYDLDLRIFPDDSYKILDKQEYRRSFNTPFVSEEIRSYTIDFSYTIEVSPSGVTSNPAFLYSKLSTVVTKRMTFV